jgi:type II secretion system protein I
LVNVNRHNKIFSLLQDGFALIEILIAITILSISLIGIISGVSSGVMAISANRNITKAMIIAKNKINEFDLDDLKGSDIKDEKVKEYPGFSFSRETKKFENELLGAMDAKKVEITVTWDEKGKPHNYSLSYIYPSK